MRRLTGAGAGILVAAALLAGPRPAAWAATAQQWQLTGPGGAGPAATVALDTAGKLTLSVRRGSTQVLQSSAVGIRTSAADLSTGLAFRTRTDAVIHEEYATASGRRRQHTADANQTTLSFTKGSSRLDVVVRVATDGVAYRYVVRQSGTVAVTGEASEFAVPASAAAVLLPYETGRNDYENVHVHTTVGKAAALEYGYPSLFHVADTWLLVTESDLNGTYGGTRLTLNGSTHRFRVTLPDSRETNPGSLATPWRTLVLGDLATVTESDFVTDLAAPSKVADPSWIRPGRAAWSWWSDGSSAGSLTAQEKYTDFAAKMGWEYVLVDAGWSASWIPTLVKYAQARHVGVWIWTRQPDIDTQAKISAAFALWKSWGVVGLKIDHIRSEQQVRLKWYDQVLATSAQNELMVDFHGSTIPRGIERTWPQVLTMEGVQGAEKIHNKPGRTAFPPTHYTDLPFTRNLAGSMDYTPVTFTAKRTNTDAAELAQSVVFESGLQNYADSVESYDAHPVAERLLRQVPSVWDETKLLSGDPDSHVILARRNGSDWFVGAILAGAGRTVAVPLSFLGTGSWSAELYVDGTGGLTVRTQQVTAADTLSLAVPANGGFTVRLTPAT
ncbi:MAG: alpha-glucosidase [Actinobacteria bacterium 13_2_20CM_2_72_6]|nr:MAG: alpha-glucosidase [Actinobacteria bacterium 13_2_20CM_2_72_6]